MGAIVAIIIMFLSTTFTGAFVKITIIVTVIVIVFYQFNISCIRTFYTFLRANVTGEGARVCKTTATMLTLEWLFARMNAQMFLQMVLELESLFALVTLEATQRIGVVMC